MSRDRLAGDSPERYVYFLAPIEADSPVKIGTSHAPDWRVRELSNNSPTPLRLLGVLPGTKDLERLIHKQFAKDRLHGEWFCASPELSKLIASTQPFTKRTRTKVLDAMKNWPNV